MGSVPPSGGSVCKNADAQGQIRSTPPGEMEGQLTLIQDFVLQMSALSDNQTQHFKHGYAYALLLILSIY